MSVLNYSVPTGIGSDAKGKVTDWTKVVQVNFPPKNAGTLKWGANEISVAVEGGGAVILRVSYKPLGKPEVVRMSTLHGGADRTEFVVPDGCSRMTFARAEGSANVSGPIGVLVESILKA